MLYRRLVFHVFVLGLESRRTATNILERPLHKGYTDGSGFNFNGGGMSEVKLHLGDCLEIMKSIPDKSIDLVLTDPPYGIGADDNPIRSKFIYESVHFDKERPQRKYFDEMIRVSKNQIIWGGELFY